jgi:DNA-directed RNA polymerase subunit RPC12/RpoP
VAVKCINCKSQFGWSLFKIESIKNKYRITLRCKNCKQLNKFNGTKNEEIYSQYIMISETH